MGTQISMNCQLKGDGKPQMSYEAATDSIAGKLYKLVKGADEDLWGNKDIGFNTVFEKGTILEKCRSIEAVSAFLLDARMLGSTNMTDYSAFLQLYEPTEGDEKCGCSANSKPTFPVVLRIKKGGPLTASTMMAIGVLDYLETTVNEQILSTMKQPWWYNNMWFYMFNMFIPKQFLSEKAVNRPMTYFNVDASEVNNGIKKGDRVLLAVPIHKCRIVSYKTVNFCEPTRRWQQIPIETVEKENDEQKRRTCENVLPGTEGTVAQLGTYRLGKEHGAPPAQVFVQFDDHCKNDNNQMRLYMQELEWLVPLNKSL